LRALRHLELDPLVLLQRAVPRPLDGGEVDEHVLTAAVDGDEPEPLLGVEPLDGALCHVVSSCSLVLQCRQPNARRLAIRPCRTAACAPTAERTAHLLQR